MIPPTVNGLAAMACVSAMQKCIRRNMEREAMEFAVEMLHTSKAFCTMVCNRLELISHEDIDTESQPHIVPFVATCCEQARRLWKPVKKGTQGNPAGPRLILGNAIRMMCRADKSREGDHFQCAVGQASLRNGFVPEIPDFAFDMHTMKGRRMKRGMDHFLTEGTRLVPEPATHDQYRDEAVEIWTEMHADKQKAKR